MKRSEGTVGFLILFWVLSMAQGCPSGGVERTVMSPEGFGQAAGNSPVVSRPENADLGPVDARRCAASPPLARTKLDALDLA